MKIGAKRFLSLMLCCIMVLGLFSVTAFAVDDAVKTVEIPFEKNGMTTTMLREIALTALQ